MPRLGKAVLLLAVGSLLSLAVTAPAADAGGRSYRCDTKHWHTYIGLESPVLHLRWGDLNTSMHTCWDKSSGLVLHGKTTAHMQIIPNGTSDTFGTHWEVYSAHQASYSDGVHQNYSDKRYIMGTFRNCQGIGSARICGPTGHFTVVLTFFQHRLALSEGGNRWEQYRRAGEPYKAPDNFDKKVRFYNTP